MTRKTVPAEQADVKAPSPDPSELAGMSNAQIDQLPPPAPSRPCWNCGGSGARCCEFAADVDPPMAGPNPSGLCLCGCGAAVSVAAHNDTRKGWVKGQPVKFIAGHQRRKSPVQFLVDEATGCWVWQRARSVVRGTPGYGQISIGGKVVYAHRWFYEQAHGPIPEGLVIDHLCENRACVNPAHLEAVTNAENIRRGVSPLSPADVDAIRRSPLGGRRLARAYEVSRSTIQHIRSGRHWRNEGEQR